MICSLLIYLVTNNCREIYNGSCFNMKTMIMTFLLVAEFMVQFITTLVLMFVSIISICNNELVLNMCGLGVHQHHFSDE